MTQLHQAGTMTTTSHLLETTAIGLACLLSLSILIRFHDGSAAEMHHANPPAFRPAYAKRGPVAPSVVEPNDEVRKILADMMLHD
jgi:hypothetical protein